MSQAAPIYYGWKIVAAILFTLTFSSGLSFYNHSIYLNALAATPAFTVQTASIAVSRWALGGPVGAKLRPALLPLCRRDRLRRRA